MHRSKVKYVIVTILLLVTTLTVYGNDANKLQNQIKNLTNKQKQIEKQINQNVQQQKNVFSEIQKLEKQIDKIENEIDEIEKDIIATQKKVDIATRELVGAEASIGDKKDLLGARLNVMYRNGTIGYAEVLLSSKDFQELLTNLDMVKKIVQHDVDLLKNLQDQRDLIEDKKFKLEADRRQLISLKNNIESKRKDLQASRGQQERLRKTLVADKAQLEKQYDAWEKEIQQSEAKLKRLQSSGKYVGGQLQWPVPGYTRISSPYGSRIHPILKTQRFHTGIDVPAPTGTPIVSAGQGKVVFSGDMGGYGRTVIVDHGGGIMTLYAHNSRLLVSVGDSVTRGQKIAAAGSTGLSTGPHLHFEVRKDGKYVDPIPYVK